MAARYSPLVMDHFLHPRRVGELPDADARALAENAGCGDALQLHLKITDDRITDARFKALGCTASIAASSFLAEWLVGKSLDEARALSNESLAEALGGLPAGKTHCSVLAREALDGCLADYRKRAATPASKRSP